MNPECTGVDESFGFFEIEAVNIAKGAGALADYKDSFGITVVEL